MAFTEPSTPFTEIQSPALNGLKAKIIKPDAKLAILFCKAKPIAIPKAPKAAKKLFVGNPTKDNADKTTTDIIV